MKGRNRRTLFLAILATATFVWSAIYHFDVPAADMAWLGVYSAIGVLGIVLMAGLTVATLQGLRLLWQRLKKAIGAHPPASGEK